MAVFLDVRVTGAREVAKALARFGRQVSQPAMANAINRTLNKTRTETIVEAGKRMGGKRSQFVRGTRYNWRGGNKLGALYTVRARAFRRPAGELHLVGRPHNLIRFGAVSTGKGVLQHAYGQVQFNDKLAIINRKFVVAVDPTHKRARRLGRSAYGPGLAETFTKPAGEAFITASLGRWFVPLFIASANHQLARRGYRARIT